VKRINRTALVTGASRGIGREIALGLAREGARVAITGRDTEELNSLHHAIESLGAKCSLIVADLAAPDAVSQILERWVHDLGQIEILVNNAGIGSSADPKPVVEFDDAFWRLTLHVNLTVPYLLCKGVLPAMIERRYGRIINIASIGGKTATLHGSAYSASKHGLLGLTRTLAVEVASYGITVNAVCPGPVRTLMNEKRIAYDAARSGRTIQELEASMTRIGRRLNPGEVAALALYLASDDAAAITGEDINIDGGILVS
jgi:NAD(P)-dependent dehydrogenase (short-subunit alcohol dehydrogenase family)